MFSLLLPYLLYMFSSFFFLPFFRLKIIIISSLSPTHRSFLLLLLFTRDMFSLKTCKSIFKKNENTSGIFLSSLETHWAWKNSKKVERKGGYQLTRFRRRFFWHFKKSFRGVTRVLEMFWPWYLRIRIKREDYFLKKYFFKT